MALPQPSPSPGPSPTPPTVSPTPPPTVTRTYTGNRDLRHQKPKPPRTRTGLDEQRRGGTNGTGSTSAVDAAKAAASASAAAAAKGAGPLAPERPLAGVPLINKPIHPLSESTFMYGRDRVSLQRGIIMRTQERAAEVDPATGRQKLIPSNQRYRFRFLYNPESISYSTNAFAGRVPLDFKDPDSVLQARFVGQETVSFGLMLDRTQEAYDEGIKTRGTLPDLEALYRVVNGNSGLTTGFLYLSSVIIYWGPYGRGIGSHSLPPFSGYITSINVEHTKFTPRMCPIRSVVSISAARIAEPAVAERADAVFGTGETTK